MMNRRFHLLPIARVHFAVAIALACGSAAALAQSAPPSPASDSDALRGPVVKTAAPPKSLVQHDMSGQFVRLDTRPEQAAISLLGLNAEEQAAADKVLTERFAAVTKVLREHQDLFLKIQASRQGGGSMEELRPLMREMRGYAVSLLDPPLEDRVADALPEGKRAEFRALVDEYKRVSAAENVPPGKEKAAEPKPDAGEGRAGPMAAGRVEMNLVLREMARALQSIVVERKDRLEALLKAVEATPEQEAKIQAIVREKAEKPEGAKDGQGGAGLAERTPEQRAAVWDKIMAVLTPEQREKAREARRTGG